MSKQKFHLGDKVMIASDLGFGMSCFTGGVCARVVGSYADEYGGDDVTSYTLEIKGEGRVAWYEEHQLTLIK